MDFALSNWGLVANISLVDQVALGKGDLQHSDHSRELKPVEALVERLILVNDGDVADLVDLVEPLNSVLDELGKVHCALDSV